MCQKKAQIKKCKIKEVLPMDMKDFSPEERDEYNRILKEESKGTGISIYDYYNITEEDI